MDSDDAHARADSRKSQPGNYPRMNEYGWLSQLPDDSSYLHQDPPTSSQTFSFQNSTSPGFPSFFEGPPNFDLGPTDSFWTGNEEANLNGFFDQFDHTFEFNPLLPESMPVYPSDSNLAHEFLQPMNGDGPIDNAHRRNTAGDSMGSSSNISLTSSNATIVPRSKSRTPSQPPPGGRPHERHPSGNGADRADANQPSGDSESARDAQKLILSGPQKRLNHVKSEKRRRDTIRDGYLTLTKLLSPSGPGAEQFAIPIPRRGRPKGSGRTTNGGTKKTGKGKSGVLFRAVEYVKFLDEAVRALEEECARLEGLTLGDSDAHVNGSGGYVGNPMVSHAHANNQMVDMRGW